MSTDHPNEIPWSQLTPAQQAARLEHEYQRDLIEDATGIRPTYVVGGEFTQTPERPFVPDTPPPAPGAP